MNTFWSTQVQGVRTLYDSRKLRFDDRFQAMYRDAFRLSERGRLLEIGCGPGALADAMHRWYPNWEVIGVDRDDNFIQFARTHVPGVRFETGDATQLAYPNGAFDATISHTVVEHVPTAPFFSEQFRVLKPGGVCLTLSVRRSISVDAPCLQEESPLEAEVWARVQERFEQRKREAGVAAHALSERELPLAMEKAGFRLVSTHYLAVSLTPDNPATPPAMAHAFFEEQRQMHLESAEELRAVVPEAVTAEEVEAIKAQRSARIDRRLALYEAGERQWDASIVLLMALRGLKPD